MMNKLKFWKTTKMKNRLATPNSQGKPEFNKSNLCVKL